MHARSVVPALDVSKYALRGLIAGRKVLATTILDRLMHRAHLLEFEGKSYRLKEAASRLTGLVKQIEPKIDPVAAD